VLIGSQAVEFVEDGRFERLGIRRRVIAQASPFEVTPYALNRIQIRGVCGELFKLQTWEVLQELADGRTLVHRATVPHDDHRAAQVLEKFAHEPGDRGVIEVVVDEAAEVQAETLLFRRQRQGADDRHLVTTSTAVPNFVEELWSLASQSHGATNQRRQEKAALVDEDNMCP